MSEIEQSVNNDVVAESSPAPESSSSQAPENTQQVSSESKPAEMPFHEHPRWKEIINERNQIKQQLQDYENRFKDLNSRVSNTNKEPSVEEKLIQRLKGIDPEFGSWAEAQQKAQAELKALKDWKESEERRTRTNEANSALDKLHAEHKVPEPLKRFYTAAVRVAAMENPNLQLSDLPSLYREVHDNFSKYMESTRRQQVAQYTQTKTQDAAVPAAPKGSAPRNTKGQFSYSADKAEARAQIVANAMKSLRSQS